METRRLEYLVDLDRLGSMRAVAELHRTTTSVVSQQLALLQQELGARLLECPGQPDGVRRGRQRAGHRPERPRVRPGRGRRLVGGARLTTGHPG